MCDYVRLCDYGNKLDILLRIWQDALMPAKITEFDTKTPAGRVLTAAGGIPELAKHLGLKNKVWIWRWMQPHSKGGTDGRIPQEHFKKILRLAALYKWDITASDLI